MRKSGDFHRRITKSAISGHGVSSVFLFVLLTGIISCVHGMPRGHGAPPPYIRPSYPSYIKEIQYTPDCKYAGIATSEAELRFYDVATGTEVNVAGGLKRDVQTFCISNDGKYLVVAEMYRVSVYDFSTGRQIKTFRFGSEMVTDVTPNIEEVEIVPDGSKLVLIAGHMAGRIIEVWDSSNGSSLYHMNFSWANGSCLELNKAGTKLLAGFMNGDVVLFDVASGADIFRFTQHVGDVNDVAFSPDEEYAVSASDDGTMILWDLTAGMYVRTFAGHKGWVNTVSFTSGGKYLVSGATDGRFKFWDVATGDELLDVPMAGHKNGMWLMEVSPDGTTAVYDDETAGHIMVDFSTQVASLGSLATARASIAVVV